MAKKLGDSVAHTMTDWAATAPDRVKPQTPAAKQFVETTKREVVSAVLVGARVAKIWTSPDGRIYTLVALPLDDNYYQVVVIRTRRGLEQATPEQRGQIVQGTVNDAIDSLDAFLAKLRDAAK